MAKYCKKIMTLFTLFVVLLSSTVAFAYSDVSEDFWAYEYIDELTKRGIFKGYPDGTFMPYKEVTREEFAKILVSTLDLKEKTTNIKFADVDDDSWSKEYIELASKCFTVYKADNEYYFKPFDFVTKEDIAVTMVCILGLTNNEYNPETLNQISDKEQISSAVQKYVAIAIENEFVHGFSDGTFRPQVPVVRASIAHIMCEILAELEGKSRAKQEVVNFEKVPMMDEIATTSGFYGVYASFNKDGESYTIDLTNAEGTDCYEFAKNSEAIEYAASAYNNGDDNTGSLVWVEFDDEGRITVLREIANYQKNFLKEVLVSSDNIYYGKDDNEYFAIKEFTRGSFDEEQNAIVNKDDENDFIKVNNETIIVNIIFDDKQDAKPVNDEFIVDFEERIARLDLLNDEKVVVIYDANDSFIRAKYVIIWRRL